MALATPSFLRMFMTKISTLIDDLEPRRLLSASLNSGLLTVNGTNNRDVISIFIERKNPKNLDVKLNGSVKAFSLANVRTMLTKTVNGDDSNGVDDAFGNINIPVTVL